jgi:hypothetical protein
MLILIANKNLIYSISFVFLISQAFAEKLKVIEILSFHSQIIYASFTFGERIPYQTIDFRIKRII